MQNQAVIIAGSMEANSKDYTISYDIKYKGSVRSGNIRIEGVCSFSSPNIDYNALGLMLSSFEHIRLNLFSQTDMESSSIRFLRSEEVSLKDFITGYDLKDFEHRFLDDSLAYMEAYDRYKNLWLNKNSECMVISKEISFEEIIKIRETIESKKLTKKDIRDTSDEHKVKV